MNWQTTLIVFSFGFMIGQFFEIIKIKRYGSCWTCRKRELVTDVGAWLARKTTRWPQLSGGITALALAIGCGDLVQKFDLSSIIKLAKAGKETKT